MPLPGEIPVTIITGFLGAGKTTLLNHILREKGNRSIAVIENEFGEVNIDRELVLDNLVEQEDLVSMQNGCVCCSLRKDIVRAFAEIDRRNRHRRGGKKVDAIILETTGLADPAPVAFTFFANPWVACRFRLDSIICVVDARYLMQHLEDAHHFDGTVNEAVQQIAFADLILLNKVDLVDRDQIAKVTEAIRELNKSAQIIECQLNQEDGRPPFNRLLGNNLFSVKRAMQIDPAFLESDSDSDESDDESQRRRHARHAKALAHGAATTLPSVREDADADVAASCPPVRPEATAAAAAQAAANASASSAHAGDADEAAERSGGEAGPSSTVMTEQRAFLAKYGIGSKRPADDAAAADDCEDNCRDCSTGTVNSDALVKGDRRPKRKVKRVHDLSDVSSVAITARGDLDEYRFNMFMRDLLNEKAKDIFRCKGILSVHGYGDRKFVFQGVHETITYGPSDNGWRSNEARVNQIVFIGRGLERKGLVEGLRTCVWMPLPEGWQEFRDAATNAPYYVNSATGEKSWMRPDDGSGVVPEVFAVQGPTQQPARLLPKRTASMVIASPTQVVNG